MATWLKTEMTFLAKNFVLLGIGEFASKICSFVAFAYLARVLGPSEFGQLEFALALIFFFTLLVGLWSGFLRRAGNRQGRIGGRIPYDPYSCSCVACSACLLSRF